MERREAPLVILGETFLDELQDNTVSTYFDIGDMQNEELEERKKHFIEKSNRTPNMFKAPRFGKKMMSSIVPNARSLLLVSQQ